MENMEESERLRREGRSGEERVERAGGGQGQGGPWLAHIVLGSIHLNKGTILTCVPAGRGFVAFWVLLSSPPPVLLPLLSSLPIPSLFHPVCIKVPPRLRLLGRFHPLPGGTMSPFVATTQMTFSTFLSSFIPAPPGK